MFSSLPLGVLLLSKCEVFELLQQRQVHTRRD
jgi:hypothetical protein